MDLLQLRGGANVAAAVQKAFGGYVIAADSATAGLLVQRYGLASVTLDGTVSHR